MIVTFVDIGGIVCWPYLFILSFQNQIGWSCSYVSRSSTYLCNQCISPLTCDMSVIFSGFLTNITDRQDITEILLKVVLNTITLTPHNKCSRFLILLFVYLSIYVSIKKIFSKVNFKGDNKSVISVFAHNKRTFSTFNYKISSLI
jgi:hypothetical protein